MLIWKTTLHLSQSWKFNSNSIDIKYGIFKKIPCLPFFFFVFLWFFYPLNLTKQGMHVSERSINHISFTWMILSCLLNLMIISSEEFQWWYWNKIWTWQVCKSNTWNRKTNKISINQVREQHNNKISLWISWCQQNQRRTAYHFEGRDYERMLLKSKRYS